MTNLEFIMKKRAADNGGYDRRVWNEDGSVYAEVLSWTETNPFANLDVANNGGGYSQPAIYLLVGDNVWYIEDTSCGDFGTRVFVARASVDVQDDDSCMGGIYWECCAYFGSMLDENQSYTQFFKETDEVDINHICFLLNGEYSIPMNHGKELS